MHDNGSYLRFVWQKYGAGQIAGNTRTNVHDGRPDRSDQAFQVGQKHVLKGNGYRQMNDAGVQAQRRKQPIELVGHLGRYERKHAANIVQTGHLRAGRG